MRRFLTVLAGIVVLFLAAILILVLIPSNQYLLLPDTAHPVAPLVKVQGAHPSSSGNLYFVDVQERKATELDHLLSRYGLTRPLFSWLHPHASLVPAGDIVAPCATSQEADEAALQEMAFSQRVAGAVALKKLGYHVVVKPTGVIVSQLIAGTHAPCNLQPMDVVVSVDGTPTPTETALHNALSKLEPGDVVTMRVRRGAKILPVRVRTVDEKGRALVGFVPGQSAQIKLPLKVAIDTSGIGGPSAGLAFTLEVMQQLGRNVLHGHKVAATGEMELNGAVGEIGGVKQKTYGVRQAGADVFLVPAGDNARTARRYAGPVHVIPVHSLDQALHALATLPRGQ